MRPLRSVAAGNVIKQKIRALPDCARDHHPGLLAAFVIHLRRIDRYHHSFQFSRGAVVTARPECCEQLLDQLLLISPLTNLFAELGGCLSDCGLGWLRFRALLKQAHQLRRAVIEIALDIILYPLRCWARALRFHLAATNMPANYGAPRKTIPCSRLQHSGRKRILPSRSRHPQSMEQWTADFKTRSESLRQTHTMTTPGESKLTAATLATVPVRSPKKANDLAC